jgi:hypothetical protein
MKFSGLFLESLEFTSLSWNVWEGRNIQRNFRPALSIWFEIFDLDILIELGYSKPGRTCLDIKVLDELAWIFRS